MLFLKAVLRDAKGNKQKNCGTPDEICFETYPYYYCFDKNFFVKMGWKNCSGSVAESSSAFFKSYKIISITRLCDCHLKDFEKLNESAVSNQVNIHEFKV